MYVRENEGGRGEGRRENSEDTGDLGQTGYPWVFSRRFGTQLNRISKYKYKYKYKK